MAYTPLEQANAAAKVRQLRYPRWAVVHSKKVCSVSLLIPIIAIGIIVATRSFSLDNPSGEDYFVRNDIRTRLDDARSSARESFRYEAVVSAERAKESTDYGLDVLIRGLKEGEVPIFDEREGAQNVLTREAMAILKQAEDELVLHPEYERFCFFDPDARDCDGAPRKCVLPNSLTNSVHLYGVYTEDGRLCDRRNTSEPVSQQKFDSFLESLTSENGDGKVITPELSIFLATDATPEKLESWAVRSRVRVGTPFAGFDVDDQGDTEAEEAYGEWVLARKDVVDALSNDGVDVFVVGAELANLAFGDIALRDLSFSVAAIVLVFIIIWIHTGSAYLAGTAMAQIFLSFPLAYVFYRFVFRQSYFAALQILAIFLLLGIGADDVFVFTDAWKQAAVVLGKDCDHVTRMSWTYRRAVRAMSVTSITTAAAFFVTATSPIMPIGTLGVWAGLLILLQFFLVITIYPCAVAIWERFWRQRLFVRGFKKPAPEEADYELNLPFYQRFLPKKWRSKPGDNTAEYRPIERFFRGPWLNFVNKARYVLVAVAVALAAVSIYLATRLEPPTETEAFLPESHPFPLAFTTLQDAFPTSQANQQLRVRITWGISDVDRAGTSKFDTGNPGQVILDDSFDLKTAAAQRHVLEGCNFFGEQEDLIFQEGTIDEVVRCWIQDYQSWRKSELGEDDFKTFATDQELVDELILFGEFESPDGSKPYSKYLSGQDIAFTEDRSELVFTEIRFVSSSRSAVPESVMWPIYQEWQDLLTDYNARGPDGVNQAVATGGIAWKWQITQRALVRSMFVGIGVMLSVALVALTLSTLNWAVAILTTLIIAGIVSMLMGMIYLLGWELGITETVGVVISIGYSFDGAAHLATAYVESHSESRYDRTRDALTDLGISILFGVISTLFAGFMLFPAIITFFVKFAGLIVITVTLSLIWSLLFLPAILLIVGPTGTFGSLAPFAQKALAYLPCIKRKPQKGKAPLNDEEMKAEGENANDLQQDAANKEDGSGFLDVAAGGNSSGSS